MKVEPIRYAISGAPFAGGLTYDLAAAKGQPLLLITPKPAARGDIKAAVLALHGSADPVAPKSQRDAFEDEMSKAGVIFGGAIHAYTDVGADVPGIARYEVSASRTSYNAADTFIAGGL